MQRKHAYAVVALAAHFCTHPATLPFQAALDNLRWGGDYLMGCHTSAEQYIAQIGDPGTGQSIFLQSAEYRCLT